MKIIAARSWLETRDYRRPFVIAGGASPSATNVFVALTGEDGTVGYVPQVLHDKASGGVGHTGGASMTDNQLF